MHKRRDTLDWSVLLSFNRLAWTNWNQSIPKSLTIYCIWWKSCRAQTNTKGSRLRSGLWRTWRNQNKREFFCLRWTLYEICNMLRKILTFYNFFGLEVDFRLFRARGIFGHLQKEIKTFCSHSFPHDCIGLRQLWAATLTVHTRNEILPYVASNKSIEFKVLILWLDQWVQLKKFGVFEYPMRRDKIVKC